MAAHTEVAAEQRTSDLPVRSLFLCRGAPRAFEFDSFKVRLRSTVLSPYRNVADLSLGTYRKSWRIIHTMEQLLSSVGEIRPAIFLMDCEVCCIPEPNVRKNIMTGNEKISNTPSMLWTGGALP